MSSAPVLEQITPCIGKRGLHAALFDPLKQSGVSQAAFYQSANVAEPYTVPVDDQGLELFLSCHQAPTVLPESKDVQDAQNLQDGLWDVLDLRAH